MEKSGGESRSSTTERTISSELLLLLGCQSRSEGGVLEFWSIEVVNLRPPFLHPFITSSLAIVLGSVACYNSSRAAEAKIWEEFSGEKALAHVQRLVDLGPHPGGSEALEKARDYIEQQLRRSGWQVTRQAFTDDTPRGKIHFVNLIARFGGDAHPLFLLCSHYDTKLFDTIRFVGANDGGSSTGLLLEMARVLAINPALAAKVELVFFDGEEAFESFTATDGLYGSRHFASELGELAKNFRGGILFDMIGDKSLQV